MNCSETFFFVHELKQIITHTKGHHGWKNLNQSLKVKETIKEDLKDKMSLSIKRM